MDAKKIITISIIALFITSLVTLGILISKPEMHKTMILENIIYKRTK